MPIYKSANGRDVIIKLGKQKTEVKITAEPKSFPYENLHKLFPKSIIQVEATPILIKVAEIDEYIRKEAIRQNPQDFKEGFLKDNLTTGAWKNQRCFIIGGGPSLKGFDFSKLIGEKVIALNKAFVDAPFADILFCVDKQFQDWLLNPNKGGKEMDSARKTWPHFKGHKVWLKVPGTKYQDGIEFVRLAGPEGISTSLEKGIYDGANSGYAAINLAIALGANPIYLLGYDMKLDKDKKSHYHSGYEKPQKEQQLKIFAKKFPSLAEKAKERGIGIINLNKDSALDCFEFGDIEEITPLPPRIPNYIMVSFYTPEYANDITQLIKSVEKFNIPYDFQLLKLLPITGTNRYENWSKNVYQKAKFIKGMMAKHPGKNIVWVDADAVIQQYPFLFDSMSDYDIGIHYRDNMELLSGTLYIANNEIMYKIMNEWILENEKSTKFLEQRNLDNVLKRNRQLKIYKLPSSYCQIFDSMKHLGNPVIEHFQSSRKWRKKTEGLKKISVIIPTYNQAKFIEESIESILAQTFKNWELIIVNDGSTDNTKDILDRQIDPRIKIIHKENGGTGSALNLGFENATGEYETWLASDNKYYPNALQDMFDILETKREIDFVYSNCEIGVMDSKGQNEIQRKNYNSEVAMEWNAHKFYERYNIGVIWLWRKELRISAGKNFITEPCEDFEMTTRMIEASGEFYYHPVVSGWHRRHNENLTKKLLTEGKYIQNLHKRMIRKRDELELQKIPNSPEKTKKIIDLNVQDIILEEIERQKNPSPIAIKLEPDEWHLEKIPKIAYFYWGAERLPWLRYLTIYSFVKMNPDWEVILYYPKNNTKINTWISTEHCYKIDCHDYFDELKKLPILIMPFDGSSIGILNELPEVFKSDFLRWHLLSKKGGVWLDMDILFNKSMNYINLNIKNKKDIDTIVSISGSITPVSFHSIGFMASGGINEYYRYVISKAICSKIDFTNYQSMGIVLLNEEFPTIESIQNKFPNLNVANIAFDTVYAYYAMKYIPDIFTPNVPNRLQNHSIGIHWYAGHPKAGEFLNQITPDNYHKFSNTPIGKLIIEVMEK